MAGNTRGPVHRGESGTWFVSRWYPDLELLPEENRTMPETVSDDEVGAHPFACICSVCARRPDALNAKRRWRARYRERQKRARTAARRAR